MIDANKSYYFNNQKHYFSNQIHNKRLKNQILMNSMLTQETNQYCLGD